MAITSLVHDDDEDSCSEQAAGTWDKDENLGKLDEAEYISWGQVVLITMGMQTFAVCKLLKFG